MTNLNQAIETARAKVAGQPAWERSVAKAAAALLSGQLICTVLAGDNNGVVTSPRGTYHIRHGFCDCRARVNSCYHISALRIVALADEMPEASAPRVIRRVERDVVTGRRVRATYCDGWSI